MQYLLIINNSITVAAVIAGGTAGNRCTTNAYTGNIIGGISTAGKQGRLLKCRTLLGAGITLFITYGAKHIQAGYV